VTTLNRKKDVMAVNPIPEGYRTVTPYLIVNDVDRLLKFLKSAFNAQVTDEHRRPDGTVMHADVVIGDSHVMMGQANEKWRTMTGSILLYVPDVDATYEAALRAGGKSIQEVTDHFYGDRSGGVEDPTGVTWWISTHVEDVSPEEMERRMKSMQPA
jgi:PhnB protein